MRTREKRYADYGLTDDRVKELLAFCRNPDNAEMVRKAAVAANPPLADAIVNSLIQRYGYDAQTCWVEIPAIKADFYAYRRLTVAVLDIWLREGDDGKWEDGGAAGRIKHIARQRNGRDSELTAFRSLPISNLTSTHFARM